MRYINKLVQLTGSFARKYAILLTKVRRSDIIFNKGSRTAPEWIIAERVQKENS